ncbi:hypothetical protein Rhopal_005724-T1 [Rhodotorula paludigena]|uniref:TPR-like protein n=1 Tax=Rhodotorula paludigena TaxID=86838 RepID=A0AAV5GTY6_9BASI|nr:hypothetical protein Rhopal_005724-T1 [Rhodotorula paludigena]
MLPLPPIAEEEAGGVYVGPSPAAFPSSVPVSPSSSSGGGAAAAGGSPSPVVARKPAPSRTEAERQAFAEAKALYQAGLALSTEGQNPVQATLQFRQAAAVFGEIGGQERRRDKCLWQAGMCYAGVGVRARNGGDAEGARTAFEQARSLFHFINAKDKEAMAVYQLGLVTSELAAAADQIKACLILYLKLGDTAKEAHSLYTIGLLAASPALHDRQTAFNYLQQARVLFRRRGDRAEEGDAAYQLGKVCVARRAYEPAVRYFEEACTLFHKASSPVDEAWSQYRLALVMLKVRSASLALDYLLEARKLFADAPASDERHAEGSCLLRIAEILSGDVGGDAAEREGLKDEVRAREYYDQAMILLAPSGSGTPGTSSPSRPPLRPRRSNTSSPSSYSPSSSPSPAAAKSTPPLVRRRSTMNLERAEERRRRLEAAVSAAASVRAPEAGDEDAGCEVRSNGTTLGHGHGDGEREELEVRESGRAAQGAKEGAGGDRAWWAVQGASPVVPASAISLMLVPAG